MKSSIYNAYIFNIIGNKLVKYTGQNVTVTIPDGITSIGKYAFWGRNSLTSINIPNSVTRIGKGAFDGCSSLTSINIPDSVTSIGEEAFYECESLTSINIPESVTSIGEENAYDFWKFNDIDSIVFTDKIFVLTGFDESEETTITNTIVSRGGVVKNSVVMKTDYVIVMEDYDHKTVKYLKAKELQDKGKNIAIISSKQFYKLLKLTTLKI